MISSLLGQSSPLIDEGTDVIHRMSGYGGCIRAQVALALGHKQLPTPAWLQTMYDSGNAHEDVCIAALREKGYNVTDQQREVEIEVADGVTLLGHLDGAVLDKSVPVPVTLEVKGPGAWERWERAARTNNYSDPLMAKYSWQGSAYALAMGTELLVASWSEEHGLRTFGIEVAPHSLDAIIMRVMEIESWIARGELPPVCSQDDGPGCLTAYLHDGQPEVVEDAVLDSLVATYELWRVKEAAAKKEKEDAKRAVIEHLGEDVDRLTAMSRVTNYDIKGGEYSRKDSKGVRITVGENRANTP